MAEDEILMYYKASAKRHEVSALSSWFKCVKSCTFVSLSKIHENIQGSGGIAPRILNLRFWVQVRGESVKIEDCGTKS
jgi:hypothetical protein